MNSAIQTSEVIEEGHYHFCAQMVQRSQGMSVTAGAAYRAGEQIKDERTGKVHDYRNRYGVVHTEILAPEEAPERLLVRSSLWNDVELGERRKDAQVAREVRVALPSALSKEQNIDLLRSFLQSEFVSRGMIADMAVHDADKKGDPRNIHAHVLLTLKQVDGNGFFRTKTREWNSQDMLKHWRSAWAIHVNKTLEREGHLIRIDHRSYKDRGLDKKPTQHLGKRSALARQGKTPKGRTSPTKAERDYIRAIEKASGDPAKLRRINHPQSAYAKGRRDRLYRLEFQQDRADWNAEVYKQRHRKSRQHHHLADTKANNIAFKRVSAVAQLKTYNENVANHFEHIYRNPSQARERFNRYAAEKGTKAAVRHMQKSPGAFGMRRMDIFGNSDPLKRDALTSLGGFIEKKSAIEGLLKELDTASPSAKSIADEMLRNFNRQTQQREDYGKRYLEPWKVAEQERERAQKEFEREQRRVARSLEQDMRIMDLRKQGRDHEADVIQQQKRDFETQQQSLVKQSQEVRAFQAEVRRERHKVERAEARDRDRQEQRQRQNYEE